MLKIISVFFLIFAVSGCFDWDYKFIPNDGGETQDATPEVSNDGAGGVAWSGLSWSCQGGGILPCTQLQTTLGTAASAVCVAREGGGVITDQKDQVGSCLFACSEAPELCGDLGGQCVGSYCTLMP